MTPADRQDQPGAADEPTSVVDGPPDEPTSVVDGPDEVGDGPDEVGDGGMPPDDLPWWVGHPVVKYPGLAVCTAFALSGVLLDGDAAILVGSSLGVVVGGVGLVGGVLLQLGVTRPVPHVRFARAYPPTIVLASLSIMAACGGLVAGTLTTSDPSERGANVGIHLSIVLAVVAFLVQIASLDPMWPDRWRPPYLRRHPHPDPHPHPHPPADEDEAADADPARLANPRAADR